MERLSLAGRWTRRIGGRAIDLVTVPGSYELVGECTVERAFGRFGAPEDRGRYFLCTEGVLAAAEFTLNGRLLGGAGPYVPYRFEIPAGLLGESNRIAARIRDCVEPFGPPPGRKMDGGLIRDIYIERRPACYIGAVRFAARVEPDGAKAAPAVEVALDGGPSRKVEVILCERAGGREVARAGGTAPGTITFEVARPQPWSPESPFLYTLTVRTLGADPDEVSEIVGFRTIEIRGQDFYLNGRRLILKGVCRHEFMTGCGYSPPEEEVRREIARIKHAGFNYIRLVHSPQAPCVSRIAAELGILVSEEPGACFHELEDPAMAEPALESLRRMVRRDRNVPSVFAWLIYNECHPNLEYAVRAAAICRELQPECLVSMADCSDRRPEIKAMMKAAGLSYVGVNAYIGHDAPYVERMAAFTEWPLVFTEWGGCICQGNARLLEVMTGLWAKHSRPDVSPRIAGCAFWAWADYEEYTRGPWSTFDGWTVEGLVDKERKPKADLLALSEMCFAMDHAPIRPAAAVEVLAKAPERPGHWFCVPLEKVEGDQAALERRIEELRQAYEYRLPVFGDLMVSGIRFECRDRAGLRYPLLLGPGREEVFIPVGRRVRQVAVLGHVTMNGGYPSNDVRSVHTGGDVRPRPYGEPASGYVFEFEDGAAAEELLHGRDVLRANNICRWWKAAPRSVSTVPAAQAVLHPSYEILRVDLWEKAFETPRLLKGIRWRARDAEAVHLLYAVSCLGD
jgi:hypothetical protein